jgi:predicted DNA binding protein
MGLWEISMRSSYDYPFVSLSRQVPDTPISMWCIWNRELLQVPTRAPALMKGVERAIRQAGRVVDQWVDADGGRIFLLKCTCDKYDSIWNVVEAHECLDAPPVVFRDGWSYFRVISFDESKSRDLFRDFRARGPTELIRKRELPLSVLPSTVWVTSLFGDLTGKQTDALLQAHRHGYYSSPRQITTEHVAQSVGVSRSTYEEHLRKAENHLMAALIPYLQLYATARHPAERLPLKGTLVEPAGAAQAS